MYSTEQICLQTVSDNAPLLPAAGGTEPGAEEEDVSGAGRSTGGVAGVPAGSSKGGGAGAVVPPPMGAGGICVVGIGGAGIAAGGFELEDGAEVGRLLLDVGAGAGAIGGVGVGEGIEGVGSGSGSGAGVGEGAGGGVFAASTDDAADP